ncbi:hypothetical protein [Pseudomonas protegens]|nr:hypothetical protein [Pseudomonas protegens]
MGLTKPNQQLRRDLKEAAATLKWAGVDLFGVAKRMRPPETNKAPTI